MGGFGSGQRLSVRNGRRVTHFRAIDIRQERHRLALVPGEPARLEFSYGLRNGPSLIPATIPIVWIALPYGQRPFFECPRCGRRCCRLYLAEQCACRQCLGLSYPVQFETKQNQAFRRAWRVRKKLVQPDGCSTCGDPIPDWKKPKGMHWATFNRLRDEANQAAVELWSGPVGGGLLNRTRINRA